MQIPSLGVQQIRKLYPELICPNFNEIRDSISTVRILSWKTASFASSGKEFMSITVALSSCKERQRVRQMARHASFRNLAPRTVSRNVSKGAGTVLALVGPV